MAGGDFCAVGLRFSQSGAGIITGQKNFIIGNEMFTPSDFLAHFNPLRFIFTLLGL